MTAGITGIDHTLINVDDLEAARKIYLRLGFSPTPRGRHPQWGTGNYCMMLEDGYLELIGVVDQAEYAANAPNRGSRRRDNGLSAIALASDDAELAKASLTEVGIDAAGPKNLSRLLEGEDGEAEPRFHILHLPDGATPGISMFICRHLTPDLVRQAGWTTHRNGACRIKSVAVPVDDPLGLVEDYQRLFGHGAITSTDNVVAVRTGGASILFARDEDLEALYPDLLPDPDEAPCPAVITLQVKDVELTGRVLADAGFPVVREGRAVMVAAEDACGVALAFTA